MILMIKYLLVLAGGVGIGVSIAHGNARRHFDEELERRIKEEIAVAEEFFRLKYENKVKADSEKKAAEWFEDPAFTEAAADAAEAMGTYLGSKVDPKDLAVGMAKLVEENQDVFDKIDASPADIMVKATDVELPKPVFSNEPVGLAARFEKQAPVDYAAISKAKQNLQDLEELSNPIVRETILEKLTVEVPDEESEPETANPFLREKIQGVHPAVEISADEFVQNKSGLDQYSFTYFVGDDTLTDERDMPVAKAHRERLVSKEIIQRLKVGPEAMDGENSLYIRNPDFNEGDGVEFDITRSPGKYSDEVEDQTG